MCLSGLYKYFAKYYRLFDGVASVLSSQPLQEVVWGEWQPGLRSALTAVFAFLV